MSLTFPILSFFSHPFQARTVPCRGECKLKKKNERLPDTRITQHEPGAFSSLRAPRGPEMHQKWSHVERSAADRSKAHFSYAISPNSFELIHLGYQNKEWRGGRMET